jgi:hypothetical protein
VLTVLDFPAATFTQALGLNNLQEVVGTYMDASKNTHGFLYDATALQYQSVNDPHGVDTTIVNGINNQGQIVGFYVDSLGNTDGFLAHIVRCEQ